ncbi:Uncharacterised protein [Listeria grayi]|uniref:Uncharacterized protein n=1 Tax=Listeria grayi FSL F6-1183 TaxID=1265827 RepID=A0A829R6B6_LISGR|nr:hypothetical protein [Listeria grayi]EUJ28238.1 hypothetical protein LMUR_06719 [Listeria grayi FSL F6-1183]VEI36433.1 Uncharacterised protein [Listeria grayi]
MPNETITRKYVKTGLILLLSITLILFTQQIKLWKNPESTPIEWQTFVGLLVLWAFAFLGILISDLTKKIPVSFIRNFPVLGWVSLVSLIFCLISNFFVQVIGAVDFLSITTPVLAFAGISVADHLVDLSKTSWRVAIVAIFVFIGIYLGCAVVSQIGLWMTGAI